MQKPVPVHLISGLLGSGKTTCLQNLIEQKPAAENWLLVINEFGEVDIDSAQLQNPISNNQQIELSSVAGGCICCSAQLSLTKALTQALQNQQFDRIFIEPTGLGHPAKVIDTLTKTQFPQPLQLQSTVCIISPQQLTPQRWQKSQVMRDLVTLAELIIVNKTDLSSAQQLQQAMQILHNCYPAKEHIITSQYANVKLEQLISIKKTQRLKILSSADNSKNDPHQQLTAYPQLTYNSKLTDTQQCFISKNETGQLLSAGWILNSHSQFNRVKLKQLFQDFSPYLLRAKALLKTGNEWQLINWSEQQLEFNDIAWRQDNRLELIFVQEIDIPTLFIEEIENKISRCINK